MRGPCKGCEHLPVCFVYDCWRGDSCGERPCLGNCEAVAPWSLCGSGVRTPGKRAGGTFSVRTGGFSQPQGDLRMLQAFPPQLRGLHGATFCGAFPGARVLSAASGQTERAPSLQRPIDSFYVTQVAIPCPRYLPNRFRRPPSGRLRSCSGQLTRRPCPCRAAR